MADRGAPSAATNAAAGTPKAKGKLLLIAVPVLLGAAGAGGWFSGVIPRLLGHGGKPAVAAGTPPKAAAGTPAIYVDVPEIVTNLNVPGKRPSFMKLHAKLELAAHADEAAVTAAMPRIQDLFQTYLRDMRPDELRGSEGSYRLREELIGRAAVAAAPARIDDVLFVELIIE
jgi:flagellar FliL protein